MTRSIAHNWALVLVKDKNLAKTRLAGVLDFEERVALQSAMLHDVLLTLQKVRGLEGVTICSPDKSHARTAEHYGALFLGQPEDISDMNGAATYGSAMLARYGANVIGVLPGDLPLLEAGDVRAAFAAALTRNRPVIIPDLQDKGTNGIFFTIENVPEFRFGPDSFYRHLAAEGQRPAVPMPLSSFARDIDTPADLEALIASPSNVGQCSSGLLQSIMNNWQAHELIGSMS